jgi:DNA repair protein RadC
VELLLGFVIKGKDVKPQAKEILKKCKKLEDIFHFKLSDISGIGKETELLFKIIRELLLRISLDKAKEDSFQITNPENVFIFLKNLIGFDTVEKFVVLFLNSQNKIISYDICSKGTVNQAVVYPREIAKKAIELNTVSVILSHNHPSGNIKPSESDIRLTKQIVNALKLFDIEVLDHLIITSDDFFSFKKEMLF